MNAGQCKIIQAIRYVYGGCTRGFEVLVFVFPSLSWISLTLQNLLVGTLNPLCLLQTITGSKLSGQSYASSIAGYTALTDKASYGVVGTI